MSLRRDRIDALLRLAARVADPTDALGGEVRAGLVEATTLSAQGIELALSQHLEQTIEEGALTEMLATPPAPRCHVLLSANVCTAALRALVLASAAGERVLVRASSRDPVLAQVLVRELQREQGQGANIELVAELSPTAGDTAHLYGRSETLAQVSAAFPPGVQVLAHGSGFGIAFVDTAHDLEQSAQRLTDDVVPFDQAGCLSPRVVLLSGGREHEFAQRLHLALAARSQLVPRGPSDASIEAEVRKFVRISQALGEVWSQPDHVVALLDGGRLPLPPSARCLALRVTHSAWETAEIIADFLPFLTTVGFSGWPVPTNDAARPLQELEGTRQVELGQMQRPLLDGPVDRRVDRRTRR